MKRKTDYGPLTLPYLRGVIDGLRGDIRVEPTAPAQREYLAGWNWGCDWATDTRICQSHSNKLCGKRMTEQEYEQDGMCGECADDLWQTLSDEGFFKS